MLKTATSALARLSGSIAPEILHAPKTGADPDSDVPDVDSRVVRYLEQNVVGHPWDHHLVLLAAILSAQRRDPATVGLYLQILHPRLRDLFAVYQLSMMQEWDAERMVTDYYNGIVLAAHSNNQRLKFWKHYRQAVRFGQNWLASLPKSLQSDYERFILPALTTTDGSSAHLEHLVREEQHRERKLDTEALVPHFSAIRLQVHLRVNQMTRLRNAYCARLCRLRNEPAEFPIPFVYEEFVGTGVARRVVERWQFRIWDRRSFVLHPDHGYSPQVQGVARRQAGAFSAERNTHFLEFVSAERPGSEGAAQGLWFIELVKRGVLGQAALSGNIADKQAWLREWGHGDETPDARRSVPFVTVTPEILAPGLKDSRFLRLANQHSHGVVFRMEPLYAAAVFGLLALHLFTTTGMRINEALQLRPTRDCVVYVEKPAPAEAIDQSPSGQFVLRLIPKGERRDAPVDYYIDTEAVQLIARVGALLQEHYQLGPKEALPVVAYHAHNPRAHRFGAAPYLLCCSIW